MKSLLLFLLTLFVTSCATQEPQKPMDILAKDAVVSIDGKVFRTGLKVPKGFRPPIIVGVPLNLALPTEFDWRTKFQLSPIENQGSCGSCWAFSTAATFQDVKRIFGEKDDLSEQYLLSCANPQEWSCNGGFFAHDAHKSPKGGVLASEYPYTGTDSTCKSGINYQWKLTSWAYLPGGETPSVDEIKAAIYKYGPVSVGVAADSKFSSYSGGIFQGSGSTQLNHAVNLVGWGNGYWIMRNSWGSGWGESGYMRIKFNANGIGAWTNFIVYNQAPDPQPDPGPNPDPNPNPDPQPEPDPECEPKPFASTGYGDSITVRKGGTIILGTTARQDHTYYWTAEPAFNGGVEPPYAKIKYAPAIQKRLTIHAVTECGEATDSITVKVARGVRTAKPVEVTRAP
jgi:hypothetical protein